MEYLKLRPDIDSDPDFMELGFWATRVYELLLKVSGSRNLYGRIPPQYLRVSWLVRFWNFQGTDHDGDAERILTSSIKALRDAGKLVSDGDDLVINGWEKFYGERPKTGAERQAGYEIRKAAATRGHIYVIQQTPGGPIKIGFSETAGSRIHEMQVASPDPFRILAMVEGTMADEKSTHKLLKDSRRNREWFNLTPEVRKWLATLPLRMSPDVSDEPDVSDAYKTRQDKTRQTNKTPSPFDAEETIPDFQLKKLAREQDLPVAPELEWIGWAEDERHKAHPRALPDTPASHKYFAWCEQVKRAGLNLGQTRAAYVAFLRDEKWATKLNPPCPWDAWASKWKAYMPGQTAGPPARKMLGPRPQTPEEIRAEDAAKKAGGAA